MHTAQSSKQKHIAIRVYTATRMDVERYKQEIAARVGVSSSTITAWLRNGRKLPKLTEEAILREAAEIDCEHAD